jgi:heme A synthase
LAVLHRAVIGLSLAAVLAWISTRRDPEARDMRLWLALLLVATVVNALLGGGVSEPQPRYQARIIWLLPLVAIIAGVLWRRSRRTAPSAVGG